MRSSPLGRVAALLVAVEALQLPNKPSSLTAPRAAAAIVQHSRVCVPWPRLELVLRERSADTRLKALYTKKSTGAE